MDFGGETSELSRVIGILLFDVDDHVCTSSLTSMKQQDTTSGNQSVTV